MESIVNVVTGVVGLYALHIAARPADANHPYGHGKIEFVAAAIEGTLILAAGLLIIYEAIYQLLHPQPLHRLDTGMLLTGFTGLVNFVIGAYALRKSKDERSATLAAAGQHLKTDAFSSALVVAGVALVYVTGLLWIDSIVALLFAVFILITGYRVIRTSMAGIMDEADAVLLQNLVNLLEQNRRPVWIDLHNLRVIQYGQVLHVDAHLSLPWYLQVKDADEEIRALEDLTRSHFGGKVELFLHIDACRNFQCHICTVHDCPVRAQAFSHMVPWTVENVMRNVKHGKEAETELRQG